MEILFLARRSLLVVDWASETKRNGVTRLKWKDGVGLAGFVSGFGILAKLRENLLVESFEGRVVAGIIISGSEKNSIYVKLCVIFGIGSLNLKLKIQ